MLDLSSGAIDADSGVLFVCALKQIGGAQSLEKLYLQANTLLNAGFIAPHFPLVCPEEYWEMYPHDQIDLPPQQRIEDQPRTIQRMRRECSNGRGLGVMLPRLRRL